MITRQVEFQSLQGAAAAAGTLPIDTAHGVSQASPLDLELDFYQGYPWCLNPFLTVEDTMGYLRTELERLGNVKANWQVSEVATNVLLLSSALLNSIDDYLRGTALRLPGKTSRIPFARSGASGVERLINLSRMPARSGICKWRKQWDTTLSTFATWFVKEDAASTEELIVTGGQLASLRSPPLPWRLKAERIYFPSAFRKHDLSYHDVLSLGRLLIARFPDRQQPMLIVAVRTAGIYFAPLLRALLDVEGYQRVETVTIRPDKGAASRERVEVMRCARAGYMALVLDDSPRTGRAVVQTVEFVRNAAFPSARVTVLVPVEPSDRDWCSHRECEGLFDVTVLTLEPEAWHKHRLLLDVPSVEVRLAEYYERCGFSDVRIMASTRADQFNADLRQCAQDARRSRLKQVYEVQMKTPSGLPDTRYVLAKSVGWGWLGYHAFLTGHRLAHFVPTLLGLRDGILYTEWTPTVGRSGQGYSLGKSSAIECQASDATDMETVPREPNAASENEDREAAIRTAASYTAARVRTLGLGANPMPDLGLHDHHDSLRRFADALSRAYGGILTAAWMRRSLQKRLGSLPCPVPTLIDGKMDRSEWIVSSHGLLKTDYEHHGMGKNELNLVDPAYDLAETILAMGLSAPEEENFVRHYVAESGDATVYQRLFMNKLFAGLWNLGSSLTYLFREGQSHDRSKEFCRQYIDAWHFLTVQAARYCGSLVRRPVTTTWRSPLVILDIDGVLDRRVFGFPCTTAAGIQALSLLHTHDFAVAVDTARSAVEVKQYCQAYGLAGGVAEYGSYVWDAVGNTGSTPLSTESLDQLDKMRKALEQIPGVLVDHRYRHSIRACTFQQNAPWSKHSLFSALGDSARDYTFERKSSVPLPILLVRQLMADLGMNRLRVAQTSIDTTILAREADKGTGLTALLNQVGQCDADTVAVGDSEADLPMFRIVRRSFAPAQIGCARLAQLLGCRIVSHRYQRGLLSIARLLVHGLRDRCLHWQADPSPRTDKQDIFSHLLEVVDRSSSVWAYRLWL